MSDLVTVGAAQRATSGIGLGSFIGRTTRRLKFQQGPSIMRSLLFSLCCLTLGGWCNVERICRDVANTHRTTTLDSYNFTLPYGWMHDTVIPGQKTHIVLYTTLSSPGRRHTLYYIRHCHPRAEDTHCIIFLVQDP